MASSAAGWSEMPDDVLSSILIRLEAGDIIRAAAVCRWWRRSASFSRRRYYPPWLMVSDDDGDVRRMLNVSEGRTYLLRLPEIRDMHCGGASPGGGWVVAMEFDCHSDTAGAGDLFAFNPITRSKLSLPPITELPWKLALLNLEYITDRFILLLDRSLSTVLVVVAIGNFCRTVAFCRPGDQYWTQLHKIHPHEDIFLDRIKNVILHKGTLYLVNSLGRITIYDDLTGRTPPRTLYGTSMPEDTDFGCLGWMYLVVSYHDHLLLVRRQRNLSGGKTNNITVYRLMEDDDKNDGHWVHMESLLDEALFIGLSQPMSFSTKDHPYLSTNSIYFTDDTHYLIERHRINERHRRTSSIYYDPDLYIDIGVYNLHDGTVQHFYHEQCSHHLWPTPIWFTPSIHLQQIEDKNPQAQ